MDISKTMQEDWQETKEDMSKFTDAAKNFGQEGKDKMEEAYKTATESGHNSFDTIRERAEEFKEKF